MKEISERNNRADSDTILSPGNEGFRIIRNGIYVDKTGIINVINKTINTSDRLTCISRPRRFGKSYTAQTLCAYYGRGYDSHDLFENLEISKNSDYEKYINSFNVIYLDITGFISSAIMIDNVVSDMRKTIIDELLIKFPCAGIEQTDKLGVALLKAKSDSQIKFFFIIDEWDALFREQKKNNANQKKSRV